MTKNKFLLSIFFLISLFFIRADYTLAFPRELFVSFVFPVRDISSTTQTATDLPRAVHAIATQSATPLTWHLDYDSLANPKITDYFKTLSRQSDQEIGVLMEVTPRLLLATNLASGTVPTLLNSYMPQSRTKLIDTTFDQFYAVFGYYPSTLSAPYIDSYSLSYLQEHYSVNAAVFSKPQELFPYFSYYPSTQNAAIPAQDESRRIKLVISTFNPPDLFGQEINSSNLDQTLKDFALKDLNENTRLVLGVPNNTPIADYLPEFKKQVDIVIDNRHPLSISRLTASQFGTWFAQFYPLTSPAYYYRATRDNQSVLYYQNPFYQIKIERKDEQTKITNLVVFNQRQTEEFRQNFNPTNSHQQTIFPIITNMNPTVIDFDLSAAEYSTQFWRLFLTNGDKKISLLPDRLQTENLSINLPIHPQIKIKGSQIIFDSKWLPFNTSTNQFVLNLLKLLLMDFLLIILFNIKFKNQLKRPSIVAILFGSILWSITSIFSGSHTIFGLSFWGPHGHDAFVHLSLIESFKHSFWPLINPTLIKTNITNYHIFYDYLLALISKFLSIPAIDLYFRYFPLFMATAIGVLSAKLMAKWRFTKSATIISILLIYTAGSLGFIRGGESIFWANQAISTLINPPFAMSLVVLLLWLNLVSTNLNWKKIILLSLLGGLLIQVKSYSSVLLIASLGLYTLRNWRFLPLLLLTTLFSVIFIIPTYAQSESLFIFSPLWFVHSMVSSPDRLNWPAAASALQNYPQSNQLLKFVGLQTLLTLVFLIGNFGIRIFSLPFIKQNFNTKNPSLLIIFSIILTGTIIPLLFIQTANPWNTIQFLYYPLFFTALLSGPAIAKFIYNIDILPKFLFWVVILGITAFSTTVISLRDYFSVTPAAYIGYTELNLLDTLKRQPYGYVVSPEYSYPLSRSYPDPKPVHAYTSTAYVSALSGQPSYIADEINLMISNYNFQDKSIQQQRLYRTSSSDFISEFLTNNQIHYLLTNPQFQLKTRPEILTPIFDSGYFNLYTVNK